MVLTLPGREPEVPVEAEEIDPRLVAWWKMKEGTGTTLGDSTGKGNTVQLVNGPQWANDAQAGACLEFDGINDRYGIGVAQDGGQLFGSPAKATFACWIKCAPQSTAAGSSKYLIWPHPTAVAFGFQAGVNSPSGLISPPRQNKFFFQQSSQVNLTDVTVSAWKHVVAVMDGGTGQLRMYSDGALENTIVAASLPAASGGFAYVLGLAYNGSAFASRYAGRMRDMRIFNDTLTAAEVNQLYSGSRV
jgi:hypothetical protein